MNFINVLTRLQELDGGKPAVEKPVAESLAVAGDGVQQLDIHMEEPDVAALKTLSGLNESAVQECGMPTLGAPMPTMPTTINMSAPTSSELVGLIRGMMNLAKTDTPSPAIGLPPANIDQMVGHKEPLVAEPPAGAGHEVPVSGPTFGSDAGAGGSGEDELADMIRKIKTGEPVKISTDMPVKVNTDDKIKASTSDKLNVKDDEKDEGYDNTPNKAMNSKDYNPNDFVDVVNKVRDFDYTPPGSASNPMPDKKDDKKEESLESLLSFEESLMAEYKQFVSEAKKSCCCEEKGKTACPVHGKKKVKEAIVAEKSVSKAQQRFMGMVHAAQKGEKPASKEVAKAAKGMTKKAGHDFAATKHKGLPEKKKKTK